MMVVRTTTPKVKSGATRYRFLRAPCAPFRVLARQWIDLWGVRADQVERAAETEQRTHEAADHICRRLGQLAET
jgi:hypothetical protein